MYRAVVVAHTRNKYLEVPLDEPSLVNCNFCILFLKNPLRCCIIIIICFFFCSARSSSIHHHRPSIRQSVWFKLAYLDHSGTGLSISSLVSLRSLWFLLAISLSSDLTWQERDRVENILKSSKQQVVDPRKSNFYEKIWEVNFDSWEIFVRVQKSGTFSNYLGCFQQRQGWV